MYVWLWFIVCVCVSACLHVRGSEENFWEFVLFSHHMVPGAESLLRVCSKCCYLYLRGLHYLLNENEE